MTDSDIGRMVNCMSVNRFDKTWSQRTHDWGVEKRVNPRRFVVGVVVLTIGTFWMRGRTARQSHCGCWSIEASIEVVGNRLRVDRGRTQLTIGVVSALCVTLNLINHWWSAGFHRNWWIWLNIGTGGWSSMFCVKHRFSSMISFTDDVALFIDVFTWFHRWFFLLGHDGWSMCRTKLDWRWRMGLCWCRGWTQLFEFDYSMETWTSIYIWVNCNFSVQLMF